MALFQRTAPASPAAPPPVMPSERVSTAMTRIAAGSEIRGTVAGATEVWIEGKVAGDVELEAAVVVAPGGEVEGNIAAHSVRIAGRVQGDVRARDRVEILASGVLEGDLAAAQVILAEGAFFKGRVEMKGGDAKASQKVAEKPAAKSAEAPDAKPEAARPRQDTLAGSPGTS